MEKKKQKAKGKKKNRKKKKKKKKKNLARAGDRTYYLQIHSPALSRLSYLISHRLLHGTQNESESIPKFHFQSKISA